MTEINTHSKKAKRAEKRLRKAQKILESVLAESCDWMSCIRVAKWVFHKAVGAYDAGAITKEELAAIYSDLRSLAYRASINTGGEDGLRAVKYYLKVLLYFPRSRNYPAHKTKGVRGPNGR